MTRIIQSSNVVGALLLLLLAFADWIWAWMRPVRQATYESTRHSTAQHAAHTHSVDTCLLCRTSPFTLLPTTPSHQPHTSPAPAHTYANTHLVILV